MVDIVKRRRYLHVFDSQHALERAWQAEVEKSCLDPEGAVRFNKTQRYIEVGTDTHFLDVVINKEQAYRHGGRAYNKVTYHYEYYVDIDPEVCDYLNSRVRSVE